MKVKKKNIKKQYVVVGLGRFGQSVARYLETNGCTVLAVDSDSKKVNIVSEYVTRAMCLDISDEEAVQELGLSNFDGVIIAIGNHLESTIFAIIWAKEAGVKQIIAKAYDETQGKILSKVGANEIIYPEREMGYQLAKNLAFGKILDAVELTADYSIAEIPVMQKWIGKSLIELKLRERYHINVIAVKRREELEVPPSADKEFEENDIIVFLGRNGVLKRISELGG